ncbi:MAG: 2-C-methyl-D-erythritol 4-phosphate cytidylyltransferase [Gaiellaceae bacterium]|nr:2-C-methyl-D-erythritol 4-phosphate cytidylyltransferase [Gaiellaceae bacterium]
MESSVALPPVGETWAILVGAGAGDRLGADRPKAFVRFRGRTMLAASLAVFDDHPAIDGIVCVVPAGYEDRATLVVDDLLADKVSAAVAGGATRARSVAEGLVAVPASAAFVLVHDAARPLVTSELIDRVMAGLTAGAEAVIPGVPMVDTVKRVAGGRVLETLARDELVSVQTPQGFTRAVLAEALAAEFEGATDCASLAEHIGRAVTVVEGDPGNYKITSPEDLARADPPQGG